MKIRSVTYHHYHLRKWSLKFQGPKVRNQNTINIIFSIFICVIFLDDGNVLTSILYYISILSGPLFAATAGSFLCLIPMHNVLEHPEYWYEEVTCRILAAGILYPVINLIRTEYWSNLFFGKRVQTYMLFIAVSPIVLFSSYITYLYFWNIHLELFLPMPLNHIVGGSVLLIIITVFLRFRYTSQVFFCWAESLEKSFSSVHTCM